MLEKILNFIKSAVVTSAAITPLEVDGWAGKKTVKMLQGYFGCPQDGVLDGQKEKLIKTYAPNVTAVKYNKLKSTCVMKLQAWVGFEAEYINGVWDNNLSYALQIKLTDLGYSAGDIDAVFGAKSVKALQRFLNAQIPQPEPTPTPTKGDEIIAACKKVAARAKNAKYHWRRNPSWDNIDEEGSCVSFVAVVLQLLGYKKKGNYVWQNGKGYGTGKVTGTTKRMTVIYMGNPKLSECKDVIQKGDILVFDDNKSGVKGDGGHICIANGTWSGDNCMVWDIGKSMYCERNQKPRSYDGSHKLLAIVRLK